MCSRDWRSFFFPVFFSFALLDVYVCGASRWLSSGQFCFCGNKDLIVGRETVSRGLHPTLAVKCATRWSQRFYTRRLTACSSLTRPQSNRFRLFEPPAMLITYSQLTFIPSSPLWHTYTQLCDTLHRHPNTYMYLWVRMYRCVINICEWVFTYVSTQVCTVQVPWLAPQKREKKRVRGMEDGWLFINSRVSSSKGMTICQKLTKSYINQ